MTKAHRLKTRKPQGIQKKGLPLNFLLGCGQIDLENFQLARLAEVSDLRKELHSILDRVIDAMSQAALLAWFKSQDRQSLKHAIENEESPLEWAKRLIRERGQTAEELLPLPALEPGVAHLAAALRYQERNIAEGKCSICPKPLARHSVRYCEEHLAIYRHRAARKKGPQGEPGSLEYLYGEVKESTHGRQLGTLASLAMNREKKTRALLAELGIPPESAAVSLKAAKEALVKCMPDSEASAMTAAQLFDKAVVPTNKTGGKALRELLAAGTVQRITKGGKGNPFWYFATPSTADPAKRASRRLPSDRTGFQTGTSLTAK